MSGQNTPISAPLSSRSLNTPRVSVEATINSDTPGIETLLAEFFSGAKLFAKIRHKKSGITTATVQGHPKLIPSFLEYLKNFVIIKYDAAIVWGETIAVTEENRLFSVTIENTIVEMKRDQSSGEFLEKHFEEISFGASAATENLKKIVKETFSSITDAATGFAVAKGWIPAVKEKHISIKYKDQRYALEVSSIQSLEMLIQEVSKKIQIPQPIKLLYTIEDNDTIIVTDVKDLREGFLYYALTVNEELPKRQTGKFTVDLEQFFTIENTTVEMKRDQSSGEFLEKHSEEISFGGSAATENIKKIAKEIFSSMADAATDFAFAKGWIPAVKKKHISIKYKDQRYALEVSSIQSLEMLIQEVSKKIQIPQPIKLLYTIEDNDTIIVTDVKDLREGFLYYALTVNEELPKRQTGKFTVDLEQFFEKLKTDEDMSDAQVAVAKEKFGAQGITFKQLMKTGELAITDSELKDYGITQGGLRKAILAVIQSNVE